MNIPQSIKIGGHDYSIVLTDDKRLQDKKLMGEADHKLLTICIDSTLPDSQKQETLLHEIIHACMYFAGTALEDENKEEMVTSSISPILYTVLKENDLNFRDKS